MLTLRDYQQAAVDCIWRELRAGASSALVEIPTGGGKSAILAELCRQVVQEWDGRVVAVSFVRELIDQLEGTIKRHSPELVESGEVGVFAAGLGRKEIKRVTIGQIHSIYDKAFKLGAPNVLIVDECFTGETLVDTPWGKKRIDSVHNGDIVCTAMGNGRVIATSVRPHTGDMYDVKLTNGITIRCTERHPFFTESGWTEARLLESGQSLFSQENVRMLFDLVYASVPMRSRITGGLLDCAKGLLKVLLQEAEEPNAQRSYQGSAFGTPEGHGSQAEIKGRERLRRNGTAKGIARSTGSRMGRRICGAHHAPKADVSALLQDRHSKPVAHGCNRGGWEVSRHDQEERSRQEKRCVIGGVRVESVSRIESGSVEVVYNLQVSGHPSYYAGGVLVHNCHIIPPSGEGMFRTFVRDLQLANPNIKLIGLTATPYRLGSGLICGEDQPFKAICYTADLLDLIERGYLSKLTTKNGGTPDLTGIHTRAGDFVESELAELMEDQAKVDSAVAEIVERGKLRKAWLVFACSVKHAGMLCEAIRLHGIGCDIVTGDTDSSERDRIVADYKAGRLRCLVNVNVLSTGFDAPHVDLVALLRPTQSPGLYYQQVGRGLRKAEGKDDCLILDFSGNAERHGPINLLTERVRMAKAKKGSGGEAPCKTCPECSEVVATALRACPVCGHEFPPIATARHNATAADLPVVAREATIAAWKEVTGIRARPWTKKNAPDAPRTLRVDYLCGLTTVASEWICVEHPPGSYARTKAEVWLREAGILRGSAGVDALANMVVRAPTEIRIKMGGEYPEITDRRWPKDEEQEAAATVARAQAYDAEALPF